MRQLRKNKNPNAEIFRNKLLAWFAIHRRILPWRVEPRDPYHVWLAESMLQQTQVGAVIPYYQRWLERFPTLQALAQASQDDVLKMWEGLGYYTRARNLHRAAQIIVRDYSGHLPDNVTELLRLPGVGRYTAGAIASLAYGHDAAVLDGNIKRVLARVYALASELKAAGTIEQLWELSETLLPHGRAGEFNEALMDLGATVCTPRVPACFQCPVASQCTAYAKGRVQDYPRRGIKKALPHKHIASAVIIDRRKRCLLAQRPPTGLLGGLWEFPGGEITLEPGLDPHSDEQHKFMCDQITRIILLTTGLVLMNDAAEYTGSIKHAFTHFRITRHVFIFRVQGRAPHRNDRYTQVGWMSLTDIHKLALTRVDQKILQSVSTSLDKIERG